MPQYALAGHVFVCLQGGHVVFLDVRKDRYFALEADQTAALGALVPGWPVCARAGAAAPESDATGDALQSSLLALLLERGLLRASERDAKPATPVSAEPIASELAAEAFETSVRPSVATIGQFVVSAASASVMLKFRGFERVVQRVRRRNERKGGRAFDAQRVHELIAIFASLRPFFFTAKDMCLFEAFALSEFLALHGAFPRWVFGVQARPFAAHCWLQHAGIVINDTVDHVGRYTPIMIV
jgi:hypothetical protein